MHVRTVTAQVRPGKTQESIDLVRYSVLPVRGFYLMNDASSGKSLAISVWETEADIMAGESGSYYQEQIAKLRFVFAESPTTEHYELSVEASI